MRNLPSHIEYKGRAMRADDNSEFEIYEVERFEVIDFFPYEPSNYVHSPYFHVADAGGRECYIDAHDLDEYEGRCSDCARKGCQGECTEYDYEADEAREAADEAAIAAEQDSYEATFGRLP